MANGKSSLKILGLGIAEVIGLLTVFALILGVLNYFNILSLSRLYPSLFGSLPQQNRSSVPTPTPLTSIPCPVDPQFCSTGRLIATTFGKTKFYALAYTLPTNTNLKTVFQGTIDEIVEGGGTINVHPFIRLLKNNNSRIVAEYDFFGTNSSPWRDNDRQHGLKTFIIGDLIGIIGKGEKGTTNFPNIEPLNGANFIFSIKQNDQYYKLKVSGKNINLSL